MISPLIRINQVYAQSVYAKYKQKRYGLKNCNTVINADFADDLRNLLIRATEMEACECIMSSACSLATIEEKINTL
jgi:hypothetical protein